MPLAQFVTDLSTTVSAQFGPSATQITVSSITNFPTANPSGTPPTIFHLADPAIPNDLITVTNTQGGATWLITQGSEGTVAQVHAAGGTLYLVASGNDLSGMLQGVNNLSDVASASAALGHLGGAPLASPTFTGTVTLPSAAPTQATQAAPKSYVDSVAQGLSGKYSAVAATSSSDSYTITISSGTVTQISGTTVDGQSPAVNDYILIKDCPAATGTVLAGSTEPGNGLYLVTSNGSGSGPLLVSRAADMSGSNAPAGSYIFVEGGTANASSGWVVSTPSTNAAFTYGTTSIKFTQFSGAGEITAGTGLTKSGNTLSLTNPVSASLLPVASTSALGVIELGGDLSGSDTSQTVSKIQGTTISSPPGGTTEFLAGNGTWQIPAGSGGDTSGTATWSTATPTLAPSNGDIQAITITSTSIITGITITNPSSAIFTMTLYISGASTVGGIQNTPSAWPASVTWLSGKPPVFVPGDGVTSGVPPLVVVLQTVTGTSGSSIIWYGTASDLPLPLSVGNGGTGLNEAGAAGTFLSSNGPSSTPSWQGILQVTPPYFAAAMPVNTTNSSANITINSVSSNYGLITGYPVTFSGTLPAGLTKGQTYYVVISGGQGWAASTPDPPGIFTFSVSATLGGSAIPMSSSGGTTSGTAYVSYVIQPGWLQPVDTSGSAVTYLPQASGGAATVYLPQAPASNALVAVKQINVDPAEVGTYTTTIQTLGTDIIGRSEGYGASPDNSAAFSTTSVLTLQGQGQLLVYEPATTITNPAPINSNGTAGQNFVIGVTGASFANPGPFSAGDVVYITGGGTAPTGSQPIVYNTNYYVTTTSWASTGGGQQTFSLATAPSGGTTLTSNIPAGCYVQFAGVWTVVSDDVPLSQLDARYGLMTTAGDMIYENGTPAPTRLPIGSTGQLLAVVSGEPAWQSIDSTATHIQPSPGTRAAGAQGLPADSAHVHGQPAMLAPTGLTGATGGTSRYVGATASGAPASGTFAVGDFVIDNTGVIWICTTAGTVGSGAVFTGAASLALPLSGGTMTGELSPATPTVETPGTFTINPALGNVFSLTQTATASTISASAGTDGQVIRLRLIQDSTGSRPLPTFTQSGSNSFDFGTAGTPTLTSTANHIDILAFEYVASVNGTPRWCYLGISQGF